MHIESVRVEEFGPIDRLAVSLDEGLNVISGPNETGKSTLMRAIWFALTRRSTSQASEIRSIEPNSGGTPNVEVCLRVGGARYALEKVFNGQRGRTNLEVDPPEEAMEQYAGEEADEVLREALGFSESSGRSGVPDHFGFWPAVWVGQDDRRTDPGTHLTEEGNPESISSVLAQIGGDVLAGSGAEIVERAREEYERFFTSSGNYTSRSGAPLHEAKEDRDRAEERFEELADRRAAYEDDLDELERLRSRIDGIDEQLPALEDEAEEARAAFDRAETLRGELETAQSKLETAQSKTGRVEDRLKRREELKGKIEELEGELGEKKREIEAKEERLEAHRADRAALKTRVEEAEAKTDALERRLKELRAHLDVLRANERLSAIEEQADELQTLKERRDELTGEIAGIAVDEETVRELEILKEEHNEARTRLETAAAQLRFRAKEETDVEIGDETLSLPEGEETARLIDEPTTVSVGDLLEIDIEPGGRDLASIREEAREAKTAYETALGDIGAESVAEARSEHQRKERLENELSSVKDQIEDLMPEEGSDLEEARARLESQLETAKDKRDSYAAPGDEANLLDEDLLSGAGTLPEKEEATRERLDAVEQELETATEELETAREALETHDETAQELKEELQKAETKAEGTEESLSAARQELADHEEEHGPEEELQSDLEEAQSTAQERERRVEDLEAELEDLSPEDVEARKERAEDALETTREERRELKSDLDKVQGRLESDDLRGLHGRLEAARQDLEEAQAEVDRLQQQAEAAKLLYETLIEKRREARRQYLAPLREEVEELLSRFFGTDRATVQFGETFGVERFSRSGEGSFEFNQLSAGAKQQLSVLTRLAMARLICRERPHPVFLDDALSDTDPERFEAIANILRSVAREMQIIMTTCHHERHRRLGVTTKRMASLKQQAAEE